jgi:uncharacterized membrane protein
MRNSQIGLAILVLLCGCESSAFAQASCPTELYTRWTLVFFAGEIEHKGTLTMNGCVGEMRVTFFSVTRQRTEEITQTMTTLPRQGPEGLVIRGSNPVYSGTTVKHQTYSPDTLYYKRDTDGRVVINTCDEQSPPRCAPVTRISETPTVRISLQNNCKIRIFVAVRYQTYQGRLLRRGWWLVEPGALMQTDIATLGQYVYFYADSPGSATAWTGDGEETSLSRTVQPTAFAAEDVEQLTAGARTVNFFRSTVNVTRPTFTQSFSCK